MPSSLNGIRILDLTRILAGPTATQILGDLGADVIKIERPVEGDDTRRWGPPFLKDAQGRDTQESAYYLSANRNKKSVTVDISTPQGQDIIHRLAAVSDVIVHNFKVGAMESFGLGFDVLHARHPHLIYAAISGFGQTGPMADQPGYDILAQALCGLMGHTGADGAEPMKAGVALVDVITGLYTAIGILAALQARTTSGKGQMVDLALLDCGLASMANLAQFYLTSGQAPKRYGNAHATIVPYQAFRAADGWIVIAVGNDAQFAKFSALADRIEWIDDPRYATNPARVAHRDTLIPMIESILKEKTVTEWMESFERSGIPVAPIQSVDQAFSMEQAQERDMIVTLPNPVTGTPIDLAGSPLKLSESPVSYRHAPPTLGQDTDQVLRAALGLSAKEISDLREKGVL